MREVIDSLEGRWIPLGDRAVFRITGPDRVRYLNGQVTNDVSKNLDKEAVAACLCTLKGKVEALVWVSAIGESLIIDGELSQREEIYNRLDRYLIADDCELIDETGQMTLVHHYREDQGGVASTRAGKQGRDLWITAAPLPPEFTEESQISEAEFRAAAILAGVPRANYEIDGEYFPAELGLDRWAVDFHKGCYLGQEIVSRIESVGRVKRILRPIFANTPDNQGGKITNSLEERGEITGPFELLPQGGYLGFGLFNGENIQAQLADFEAVEYAIEARS